MKKILIFGCGLMFSCLSAMPLSDNVTVIGTEKSIYNAPEWSFEDNLILADEANVSDCVFEITAPVQLHNFNYVEAIDVSESIGFYKPIEYESFIKTTPLSHYDIYNGRELFKNELFLDNDFRKQNVPKSLVFYFHILLV